MVEIQMVLLTCVFEMKSVASRKPYKTLGVIDMLVLHLFITCPCPQGNLIRVIKKIKQKHGWGQLDVGRGPEGGRQNPKYGLATN